MVFKSWTLDVLVFINGGGCVWVYIFRLIGINSNSNVLNYIDIPLKVFMQYPIYRCTDHHWWVFYDIRYHTPIKIWADLFCCITTGICSCMIHAVGNPLKEQYCLEILKWKPFLHVLLIWLTSLVPKYLTGWLISSRPSTFYHYIYGVFTENVRFISLGVLITLPKIYCTHFLSYSFKVTFHSLEHVYSLLFVSIKHLHCGISDTDLNFDIIFPHILSRQPCFAGSRDCVYKIIIIIIVWNIDLNSDMAPIFSHIYFQGNPLLYWT